MAAKTVNNSGFPVVTVDGPAGAGKGTVAAGLAGKLGWRLLDSGLLYRLTALAAVREGVELDDDAALVALAGSMNVELTPTGEVMVSGARQESGALRTEAVGVNAARIATLPGVRQALLQQQRLCAGPPGLIAEGRDMGTVVFPEAGFKFFLTASVQERARRRYLQLRNRGAAVSLERVLSDLVERDQTDSSRSVAPLKPAADAVQLDSTGLSAELVVEKMMNFLQRQGFC